MIITALIWKDAQTQPNMFFNKQLSAVYNRNGTGIVDNIFDWVFNISRCVFLKAVFLKREL